MTLSGWLVIDKPLSISSAQLVGIVKKKWEYLYLVQVPGAYGLPVEKTLESYNE